MGNRRAGKGEIRCNRARKAQEEMEIDGLGPRSVWVTLMCVIFYSPSQGRSADMYPLGLAKGTDLVDPLPKLRLSLG